MTDLLRRFWARCPKPEIRLLRQVVGYFLVAVALLWLLGSIWIEDLQICSETEGPQGTKTSCGPVSALYFACLFVPGLLLLGWGVAEITIPGIGTFRPPWSRRGGDEDNDDAPSPKDRYLERWSELDPWSRLASRLSSDTFRDQLDRATATPGKVSRGSLAAGDAELIKPLRLGAGFTGPTATAWANDHNEALNRLRLLADGTRTFTDDDFSEGAAEVDELLADLRERQLLR